MKWLRLYSEVLRESKVQKLSNELFRAWINLLCLANEGSERGVLPELRQVAFALRISEARASQVLTQLTDHGLLDLLPDGRYQPHNWKERQRQSDDASVRMRRSRNRTCCATVTEHVAQQSPNMFAQCSPRARSETDSDTETEQPPLPPDGGAVAVAESAPLPEDAIRALEDIRLKHGDFEAEFVRREARVIDRQLGGRWDLFVEAFAAAAVRRPRLENERVLSWCLARAKAKAAEPPRSSSGNGHAAGGGTNLPDPSEVASRGCEHCGGVGMVAVWHPTPDPRQGIPASTSADCVCPRGRLVRSKRDAATAKRVPDLANVLAGRGAWRIEPPD